MEEKLIHTRSGIHIYLSHFENESRILKETKSLVDSKTLDKILVIALWKEGLEEEEAIDQNRKVWRVKNEFKWPKYVKGILYRLRLGRLVHYFSLLRAVYMVVARIRREKPSFINLHQVMILPLVPLLRFAVPKAQLIYDTHELETESNGLKGSKQQKFKRFEKWWIKRFAHVFVVGELIEKWYRETYNITNVTTVRNCPYPIKVDRNDLFRKELGIARESKIFLYQGAIFAGRGIEIILEAFKRINDSRYTVIFMGYGDQVELIKDAETNHTNIFYFPAVPPDIVLNYTASADFGISLIENVCLSYYYCLPNKLFEYLMAGIPCIASNMAEMSNYIDEHGVGVICPENTEEALVSSIKEIAAMSDSFLKQNIAETQPNFHWLNEEEKMLEVYKNLIKA